MDRQEGSRTDKWDQILQSICNFNNLLILISVQEVIDRLNIIKWLV